MIDDIYQRVFDTDPGRFDPAKDIYEVALNLTGRPISGDVRPFVKAGAFGEAVFDVSDEGLTDGIDAFMNGISVRYFAEKTHFIVLCEYTDRDIGESVAQVIGLINGRTRRGDCRTVLAVTVPDDDRSGGYLDGLGKRLADAGEKVDLYFFVREKYGEAELMRSIGGVFRLYGDRGSFGEVTDGFAKAEMTVGCGLLGLPKEGRDSIMRHPDLMWSTLCVYDRSDRMTFLRQYLRGLYDSCLTLRDKSCGELFGTCFCSVTGKTDKWVNLAEDAVRRIPRIIRTEPGEGLTLEQYFDTVFGTDGIKAVDLTVEVNLRKRYDFTAEDIDDTVTKLIDDAGDFYSTDVLTELEGKLGEYRTGLGSAAKKAKEEAKRYAADETDSEYGLREYIRRYTAFCDILGEVGFFAKVQERISRYRDRYAQKCEKTESLSKSLDKAKRELYAAEATDVSGYPSFGLRDLTSPEMTDEICEAIRKAYKDSAAVAPDEVQRVPESGDFHRLFDTHPSLYSDRRYDVKRGGRDEAVIYRRIGRYFVFGCDFGAKTEAKRNV